jgi:hypothetical protein
VCKQKKLRAKFKNLNSGTEILKINEIEFFYKKYYTRDRKFESSQSEI